MYKYFTNAVWTEPELSDLIMYDSAILNQRPFHYVLKDINSHRVRQTLRLIYYLPFHSKWLEKPPREKEVLKLKFPSLGDFIIVRFDIILVAMKFN